MNDEPATSRPGLLARATAPVIRFVLTLRLARAALLYSERRAPMLADSITYRALFSIFAAVLLGLSAATLWLSGNTTAWNALIAAIDASVPGLVDLIDFDALKAPAPLTIAGTLSLIALIGAALSAVASLRTAVRLIAGTASDDVFWLWVYARNIAVAVGISCSFLVSAFLTFFGRLGVQWVADALGLTADATALVVRLVSLLVILLLNTLLVAAVIRLFSGLHPRARSLGEGALLGGLGLLVLQELSGYLVGGATSNPLLAVFGSLLALLIWVNLSAQMILFASAYVATAVEEEHDRVGARFGAQTFTQRKVRRAEADVAAATHVLDAARAAEENERRPKR